MSDVGIAHSANADPTKSAYRVHGHSRLHGIESKTCKHSLLPIVAGVNYVVFLVSGVRVKVCQVVFESAAHAVFAKRCCAR